MFAAAGLVAAPRNFLIQILKLCATSDVGTKMDDVGRATNPEELPVVHLARASRLTNWDVRGARSIGLF